MSAVHEGKKLPQELLYHCNVCVNAFNDRKSLKRHKKSVHEKKKPHKCETCGMCFALKSHLGRHISAVHEKHKGKLACLC